MTWGWLNYKDILIWKWTYPLNAVLQLNWIICLWLKLYWILHSSPSNSPSKWREACNYFLFNFHLAFLHSCLRKKGWFLSHGSESILYFLTLYGATESTMSVQTVKLWLTPLDNQKEGRPNTTPKWGGYINFCEVQSRGWSNKVGTEHKKLSEGFTWIENIKHKRYMIR